MVVPSGIKTTGWPSVRDKAAELGIEFDPWQDGTGRLILAKRESGLYATTVGGVVISIPRQVGKTFLLGSIVFALCMLVPGLTVIWTAHRLRTAGETFAAMQGMAGRRKIKPHVLKVVLGSGEEEIQFRNGSRILFGARERGFGRGFSEVDVLVFDEAQILTENAIDDMVPATNQAKNPLILFTGTPPKPTDPGEVFAAKRARALSGKADDMVYIEFSADRDCDPLDRRQWEKANPSYPRRTPDAAMLRMYENLSEDSYIREALGIWDEDDKDAKRLIPPRPWANSLDKASVALDPVALAIEVTPRRVASIAFAGLRQDGRWHGELIERRQGTRWVIPMLVDLTEKWSPSVIVVDGRGPAASLLAGMTNEGLVLRNSDNPNGLVVTTSSGEYAQACGALLDDILEDRFRHLGDAALTEAAENADKRAIGDAWGWDRRDPEKDISPLVAVTLARYGHSKHPARRRSVYEDRGLTTA